MTPQPDQTAESFAFCPRCRTARPSRFDDDRQQWMVRCDCTTAGELPEMRPPREQPARPEGDPSAMGPRDPLPPLREYPIEVAITLTVRGRSAEDALELARANYHRARVRIMEAL